ncbi:unnamed protein product [Heligmosomoides polygyrus]|uniref:ATP-dependent DNA helicase n=1 Tax=Heligmosomoides polygyrus TaxID=6339 RepID=A0A3P8EZE5_HELPZ|nr:unnamed protein product [Heligmosomoides polygyrus]
MDRYILGCKIATGANKGQYVLIHRIIFCPPAYGTSPCRVKRRQFSVRLAYAMTISKSQGQTFDRVGVYLPSPVFSHGQLGSAEIPSESLATTRTEDYIKRSIHRDFSANIPTTFVASLSFAASKKQQNEEESRQGQKKPTNDNIRKAYGSFTKSLEERLQRWKEFFETRYNHAAPGGPQAAPPSVLIPETVASETTPTRDEVAETIKLLRNSKAAGIDGVTAEALKAGGEKLEVFHMRCLKRILNVPIRDRIKNDNIRKSCDNHCRNPKTQATVVWTCKSNGGSTNTQQIAAKNQTK